MFLHSNKKNILGILKCLLINLSIIKFLLVPVLCGFEINSDANLKKKKNQKPTPQKFSTKMFEKKNWQKH